MNTKHYDVIAFGGCYLDINAVGLPFDGGGIAVEKEIRGKEYEALPGGSGINFVRRLKQFEIEGLFIGMKGEDAAGALVAQLLHEEGLQARLLPAAGARTNIGLNMVSEHGDHVVFSLGNANQALTSRLLLPELAKELTTETYLYLGTLYKLDGLAPDFGAVIELAKQRGTTIVVDHGRITPGVASERYEQVREVVLSADYYLPSKAEFLETWEVGSIEEGLRVLHERAPQLTTVVKDGSRGAHYLNHDGIQTVPAVQGVRPSNVTGAGDTFNAGFIAARKQGQSFLAAIENGCRVAAVHIAKPLH
jgi:sugar/nucleoside kinase (ribokinase family)